MVLWASMRPTRPKLSLTSEFKFQFMKLRNWFCKGGPGLSSISFANMISRSGNQRGTFLLRSWHQIWRTNIDNISVAGVMEFMRIIIQEIWKHPRAKTLAMLGCMLGNFGRRTSKHWMKKLCGYSVKSNPCRTSINKNHKGVGFEEGFSFFFGQI